MIYLIGWKSANATNFVAQFIEADILIDVGDHNFAIIGRFHFNFGITGIAVIHHLCRHLFRLQNTPKWKTKTNTLLYCVIRNANFTFCQFSVFHCQCEIFVTIIILYCWCCCFCCYWIPLFQLLLLMCRFNCLKLKGKKQKLVNKTKTKNI